MSFGSSTISWRHYQAQRHTNGEGQLKTPIEGTVSHSVLNSINFKQNGKFPRMESETIIVFHYPKHLKESRAPIPPFPRTAYTLRREQATNQ